MRGTPLRILLALAAALALGSCGIGDDEPTVPEPNAEELLERLEAVEDNVNAGKCGEAVGWAEDFEAEVNELPAEVDDELKQGLQEGAARLVQLAEDDSECVETGTSDDGGVVETTDEPSTPEVPSTPTETETEPPPDEETEPPASDQPSEEELVPPDGDESDDGGDDGGGGESGTLDDTGGIGGGGGSG